MQFGVVTFTTGGGRLYKIFPHYMIKLIFIGVRPSISGVIDCHASLLYDYSVRNWCLIPVYICRVIYDRPVSTALAHA